MSKNSTTDLTEGLGVLFGMVLTLIGGALVVGLAARAFLWAAGIPL